MDADASFLVARHRLGIVNGLGLGGEKLDGDLSAGKFHLPLPIAGSFGDVIGLASAFLFFLRFNFLDFLSFLLGHCLTLPIVFWRSNCPLAHRCSLLFYYSIFLIQKERAI